VKVGGLMKQKKLRLSYAVSRCEAGRWNWHGRLWQLGRPILFVAPVESWLLLDEARHNVECIAEQMGWAAERTDKVKI